MIFVDTNYFLRFLLQDNPTQYAKSKQLFTDAANSKIELFTSIIVLFEVYWVLKSYYNIKKPQLIIILRSMLKMQFILEERSILEKTLDYFAKINLDLEDCYNLSFAKARGAKDFKTFDLKFTKEFYRK